MFPYLLQPGNQLGHLALQLTLFPASIFVTDGRVVEQALQFFVLFVQLALLETQHLKSILQALRFQLATAEVSFTVDSLELRLVQCSADFPLLAYRRAQLLPQLLSLLLHLVNLGLQNTNLLFQLFNLPLLVQKTFLENFTRPTGQFSTRSQRFSCLCHQQRPGRQVPFEVGFQ